MKIAALCIIFVLIGMMVSACGQQGVPGGGIGSGMSVIKNPQGEPVTCFVAVESGSARSINCLPNWFINFDPSKFNAN